MENIVEIIASFLGGSLLTAVGFMFSFSNRLTKVETTLALLCTTVSAMQTRPIIPCPLHTDIEHRITTMEARASEFRGVGIVSPREKG